MDPLDPRKPDIGLHLAPVHHRTRTTRRPYAHNVALLHRQLHKRLQSVDETVEVTKRLYYKAELTEYHPTLE